MKRPLSHRSFERNRCSLETSPVIVGVFYNYAAVCIFTPSNFSRQGGLGDSVEYGSTPDPDKLGERGKDPAAQ